MEAYFTWYPNGAPAGGAADEQVPADKFLLTVDRDPELVERYRAGPGRHGAWWEAERANTYPELHRRGEVDLAGFTDDERKALREHDHVALFGMGAHPFLTLTLFIAMFERDHGPLEYQMAYGAGDEHLTMPYPDIAT